MKKLLAMAVAMVFAFGANAQINKGEIIAVFQAQPQENR